MKLKNGYRFQWLEHFFDTEQADRPCSKQNPANFKKKGCEKPSFLLISCITKKAIDLAGVYGQKGGGKRLEKHPKNKHLFNLFNIKSLNVS